MSSPTVSTKLRQIAEQAKNYPDRVFTTLAHLIDVEFLREAHQRAPKSSAPGIDNVTAAQYAENLEENLRDLHERLRSGRYKAPPVERVWFDKEDGGQRPIGKPTFEDKIVQRAVAMLLGAIYEQDFYDYSYGFRPGRSPHHALRELRQQCEKMRIGWIVDCDVSGFFDSIDRTLLRELIKKRVNDGSLLRLIGKWLRAGVVEQGIWIQPETGTPQGGVISPILANIFLHTVLDEWFAQVVQPRMKGKCFLVRFADDFIIGCELESDARRIMEVLPKRFARFKLKIHPTKSKMISFGRPSRNETRGRGGCGTFDFLGFTFYWAKSRKGHWVIKLKTARKRLRRAQKAAWQWCRRHRHWPLVWQQKQLRLKLLGHYQYYGVRGNYRELEKLKRFVERAWRFWLSRRTRKGTIPWDKFARLHAVFILPKPRVVHCFFAPAG